MTCPSKTHSSNVTLKRLYGCDLVQFNIGHSSEPSYSEDLPDELSVTYKKSLLLSFSKGPGLTGIRQRTPYTASVDLHLGLS